MKCLENYSGWQNKPPLSTSETHTKLCAQPTWHRARANSRNPLSPSESHYENVLVSELCLFVTPQSIAHQASLSMEFSRQEYWSGLPFPSPGDLPDPGMEPRSPAFQEDSLPSEPPRKATCLKINTDLKIKQWP